MQRDAPQWSITRFPMSAAVLDYRGPQGFAVHRKSPHWRCFFGGRKTADFLGDRTSVRVMLGNGTATLGCGRKPAGILRNRTAAQKFLYR
jgi:hypothetical protein